MCLARVKDVFDKIFFPCIARLDEACHAHTQITQSLRLDLHLLGSLLHHQKKGDSLSIDFQKKA